MKYEEFRSKVENYPFFGDWVFDTLTPNAKSFRNRVSEWVTKGYLLRLKNGLYTLREKDRKVKFTLSYLANHLYTPSYISLEYAFQHYNFIPEAVHLITSVSSKKTKNITNDLGSFSYSNIKTEMFSNYYLTKDYYGNEFYIASPEKALIDFLYFRVRKIKNLEKNIFETSYRLQNLDDVNCEKLLQISSAFKMKKLDYITELLIEYIKKEWK
jgi:predicted transcriptional regulator of viral defense system